MLLPAPISIKLKIMELEIKYTYSLPPKNIDSFNKDKTRLPLAFFSDTVYYTSVHQKLIII